MRLAIGGKKAVLGPQSSIKNSGTSQALRISPNLCQPVRERAPLCLVQALAGAPLSSVTVVGSRPSIVSRHLHLLLPPSPPPNSLSVHLPCSANLPGSFLSALAHFPILNPPQSYLFCIFFSVQVCSSRQFFETNFLTHFHPSPKKLSYFFLGPDMQFAFPLPTYQKEELNVYIHIVAIH